MRRIVLLLFIVAISVAQESKEAIQLGARLDIAVPSGEFDQNVDRVGAGIMAHFSYFPIDYFSLGFGGGFLSYGSETRKVALPLVRDFNLVTSNNIISYHLIAQTMTRLGKLRPYIEGRIGGTYLYTESKLEDADWLSDDDDVANKVNYDDFAFNYGFGGGLLFLIKDKFEKSEDGPQTKALYIDLKVLYIRGGNAEYLTEGDIDIVDNKPIYHPSKSTTDMIHTEIGVCFEF
jgi:hypothetical protein